MASSLVVMNSAATASSAVTNNSPEVLSSDSSPGNNSPSGEPIMSPPVSSSNKGLKASSGARLTLTPSHHHHMKQYQSTFTTRIASANSLPGTGSFVSQRPATAHNRPASAIIAGYNTRTGQNNNSQSNNSIVSVIAKKNGSAIVEDHASEAMNGEEKNSSEKIYISVHNLNITTKKSLVDTSTLGDEATKLRFNSKNRPLPSISMMRDSSGVSAGGGGGSGIESLDDATQMSPSPSSSSSSSPSASPTIISNATTQDNANEATTPANGVEETHVAFDHHQTTDALPTYIEGKKSSNSSSFIGEPMSILKAKTFSSHSHYIDHTMNETRPNSSAVSDFRFLSSESHYSANNASSTIVPIIDRSKSTLTQGSVHKTKKKVSFNQTLVQVHLIPNLSDFLSVEKFKLESKSPGQHHQLLDAAGKQSLLAQVIADETVTSEAANRQTFFPPETDQFGSILPPDGGGEIYAPQTTQQNNGDSDSASTVSTNNDSETNETVAGVATITTTTTNETVTKSSGNVSLSSDNSSSSASPSSLPASPTMLNEVSHNGNHHNEPSTQSSTTENKFNSSNSSNNREEDDNDDYVPMSNKSQTSDSTVDVEYSFQPTEYSRDTFRTHLVKLASFNPPSLTSLNSTINDNYSNQNFLTIVGTSNLHKGGSSSAVNSKREASSGRARLPIPPSHNYDASSVLLMRSNDIPLASSSSGYQSRKLVGARAASAAPNRATTAAINAHDNTYFSKNETNQLVGRVSDFALTSSSANATRNSPINTAKQLSFLRSNETIANSNNTNSNNTAANTSLTAAQQHANANLTNFFNTRSQTFVNPTALERSRANNSAANNSHISMSSINQLLALKDLNCYLENSSASAKTRALKPHHLLHHNNNNNSQNGSHHQITKINLKPLSSISNFEDSSDFRRTSSALPLLRNSNINARHQQYVNGLASLNNSTGAKNNGGLCGINNLTYKLVSSPMMGKAKSFVASSSNMNGPTSQSGSAAASHQRLRGSSYDKTSL